MVILDVPFIDSIQIHPEKTRIPLEKPGQSSFIATWSLGVSLDLTGLTVRLFYVAILGNG